MKKRIAGVVVLVLLSSLAYIAWVKEWFATPTSILTSSLMQANAGNYQAACEHLPAGQSEQLLEDPKLMKEAWDTITNNRTIKAITVTREDRGPLGNLGFIDVTITYTDGSARSAHTTISYYQGRWTFGARELNDQIVAENRHQAFEKWTLVLAKAPSRFGKSPVLLRIPEELIWDDSKQCYDHPKYNILIQHGSFGGDFSSVLRSLEKQWTSPGLVLERREDLSRGNVKVVLFDGERKDNFDDEWRAWRRMDLVIGDDRHVTHINSILPNLVNFRKTMRECFATAQWSPESKNDR